MRGNMTSWTIIYSIFWDRYRARFPENIQSTETYTNDATLRSGFFFPENTFDDGPAFWIFSHDSRIRVDDIPIKYFWIHNLLYLFSGGAPRIGDLFEFIHQFYVDSEYTKTGIPLNVVLISDGQTQGDDKENMEKWTKILKRVCILFFKPLPFPVNFRSTSVRNR